MRWRASPSGLHHPHTLPPRPRAITEGTFGTTWTRGDVMAWVALVAAGLFETAFAVCLKLSDGLRVLWPTVGFAVSALTSFGLLTVALRELDVGPAYAVWTGIGAAGAAPVGMSFLGDAVSTMKLVSIALILAGVVGLNLS